jgi:hypothetical protein
MSDTSPKNQDALLSGHRPGSIPRVERYGKELWRLERGDDSLACELLDDSLVGAGWEIRLRKNGELTVGHRCGDRAEADYVAGVFRQEHQRTGWSPSPAE